MIEIEVKFTLDRFDHYEQTISDRVDKAIQAAGAIGKAEADRRAKVKTGYLRSRNAFVRHGFLDYELRNDAHYGPYLNFGTRYIQADHFFDLSAMLMIRAFLSDIDSIRTSIT